MNRQRYGAGYLGSAVLLTAVAYAVRLWGVNASSLWYDETFTLYHAQQGVLQGVLGLLREDNALPLHGLLLALWVKATGAGAYTARYLSVLLGTVGTPLVMRLGGAISGRRTGGWGSGLAYALLPICVYYAQEVRMYALAFPLAAGFAWMAWRLMKGRSGWPYIGVGMAMLITHLYTGLLWVTVWGWGAVACRLSNRRTERHWWQANLQLLLFSLPILAWAVWRAGADATATSAIAPDVVRWLPMVYGVGQILHEPWNMLFFGLSLLGIAAAAVHLGRDRRWPSVAWLVSGLVIPIVLILALTSIKAKWSERYLLPSLGLMWVTGIGMGWELGLASDRLPPALRRKGTRSGRVAIRASHAVMALSWSAIALLALALQARGDRAIGIRDEWHPRPDFRAVSSYISERSEPTDAIVVIGGYAAHTLDYYYEGPARLFGLPADTRVLDTRRLLDLSALGTLEERTGNAQRLWLVLWQFNLADPTNLVQSTLVERCRRLPVDQSFTNVSVLLFDIHGCRPLDQAVVPPQALTASFTAPIDLLGYGILKTDETWEIDLWWRSRGDIEQDLTVFVHLVDAQGQRIGQHDHIAGADAYPTSRWNPGTLLRDRFFINVPGGSCAGCHLWIGLYTSQGRILLEDGSDMLDITLGP